MGLPTGVAAIGKAFELYFAGNGGWIRGEVLAYRPCPGSLNGGVHLVLYEDGESEWINTGMELIHSLSDLDWVPGLSKGRLLCQKVMCVGMC